MKCLYCKEGTATYSKLWWLDVDTYLTCNHCHARLAHVSFFTTAVLYAIAVMLLYWVFQRWSVQSFAAAKRMTIVMAVVFFVLAAFVRLGLVWVLWWLKAPFFPRIFPQKPPEPEPWWKPFVEE